MVLLAWSFLVATISLICYRHPPRSWPDLWKSCFRPTLLDQKKRDAPTSKDEVTPRTNPKAYADSRDEIDRKAMPPPSFTKPSIPLPNTSPEQLTPKASTSKLLACPDVPSLSLSPDSDNEPSVPSFPAANSAQRASGGGNAPPRLNALSNPQTNLNGRTNATASLMFPLARGPLPNRAPASNLQPSSLAPPPSHNSVPSKPRKKVLLTPGHSPLDWASLTKNPSANLRGLPPSTPYLRVPPSLLKQYNGRRIKNADGGYTTREAWTSLSGKVYNITPYLPYHPGGEPELLKSAGRDGTKLFGEVHPWVNWEGMLAECLIGFMVEEAEPPGGGRMEEMD